MDSIVDMAAVGGGAVAYRAGPDVAIFLREKPTDYRWGDRWLIEGLLVSAVSVADTDRRMAAIRPTDDK
jgi:hypothetical protein